MMDLLQYADAQQAKESVLDKLEETRRPWVERAREKAREIYDRTKEPVSVVMIRAECPPPENVDPRVFGAVLRKPHWKLVGYASSCRVACHGRAVGLFIPVSTNA